MVNGLGSPSLEPERTSEAVPRGEVIDRTGVGWVVRGK